LHPVANVGEKEPKNRWFLTKRGDARAHARGAEHRRVGVGDRKALRCGGGNAALQVGRAGGADGEEAEHVPEGALGDDG
jgi:hypothetical protein